MAKDREMSELQQRLKMQVESLEEDLSRERERCRQLQAAQEDRDRLVRAPEDVRRIQQLEQELSKAQVRS